MKKDDKFFAEGWRAEGWRAEGWRAEEFSGKDELAMDDLNGVAGGVDFIKGSKAVVNSKAVDKINGQTSKITDAAVIQSFAVTEKPGIIVSKAPDEE